MLNRTPSFIALVATLGLVVLTIGAVVRPADDVKVRHVGTMVLALAWVAVLSTSLATRDRVRDHEYDDDEDDDDENSDKEDNDDAPETVTAPPTNVVPPRDSQAQPLAHGSTALLDFARELHGTLESDRLRLLIARRLPVLLGIRDVWVVARFGSRQQLIVPAHLGDGTLVSDEPRGWSTYPLKAEGRTVGLLGVATPAGGFIERDHHTMKLTASLVAQALSTADSFETLRETSLVDPLTGCATRTEGLRRFEAELRRAGRSETPLAVIMLDLDHFKIVNDEFGHKAGDAVLTAIGETLLTTLRASDVRCRWGGEEFLLVLPESNIERAKRASENLRLRIANTPVAIGDRIITVTASIGVTLSRARETDIQQLIARADTAMYEAKRRGRNRISMLIPGRRPTGDAGAADRGIGGAVIAGAWNGVERRDPTRQDRRLVPSPGRRSTDAAFAAPRRER